MYAARSEVRLYHKIPTVPSPKSEPRQLPVDSRCREALLELRSKGAKDYGFRTLTTK
jgi:hypothetical protein